ncbi:MAG: MarR family transcriptional regulator [Muribaculaceae bacterium]|nr:MarR family transcriptional regulator [Muribaculaceae bacterium]
MKKEVPHIESPAVGCMLGKAYQILLSQLAKALSGAGLDITTTEYLVLRALYSEEGIQQCEIATLTGKDKASICRCVCGLEKKGLVRTEAVSHKCLRVFLTEKAREIEPRVMNVAKVRHNALLSQLSTTEVEIFTKVLEKIITT